MNTSQEIDKIAPALVDVQNEMIAIKDASNPFFKSKYAPLDEILKSIRPALQGAGLTVVQSITAEECKITCITRIMHKSGQWIDASMALNADKATPQGFGSAATYVRRYGICAALSIATPNEDDDGNKAEDATKRRKDDEAKQRAVDEKKAVLNAHREKVKAALDAYDPVIILEVFENHGYQSECDDKGALINELVNQVNSGAKLNTIGVAIKRGSRTH